MLFVLNYSWLKPSWWFVYIQTCCWSSLPQRTWAPERVCVVIRLHLKCMTEFRSSFHPISIWKGKRPREKQLTWYYTFQSIGLIDCFIHTRLLAKDAETWAALDTRQGSCDHAISWHSCSTVKRRREFCYRILATYSELRKAFAAVHRGAFCD